MEVPSSTNPLVTCQYRPKSTEISSESNSHTPNPSPHDPTKLDPILASYGPLAISWAHDLDIIVGDYTFDVSSQVLAHASPLWEELLAALEDDVTDIKYPDSCPTTFLFILHVIHMKSHLLPRDPSLDEMYEIALFAAELQCENALRGWVGSWLSTTAREMGDGLRDVHRCAAIGWIFDQPIFYNQSVKKLLMGVGSSEVDEVYSDVLEECHWKLLETTKLQILEEFSIATCALTLARACAFNHTTTTKQERDGCNYARIVKFQQCLAQHRLWPVPFKSETDTNVTLKELQDIASSLDQCVGFDDRHGVCWRTTQKRIEHILHEFERLVWEMDDERFGIEQDSVDKAMDGADDQGQVDDEDQGVDEDQEAEEEHGTDQEQDVDEGVEGGKEDGDEVKSCGESDEESTLAGGDTDEEMRGGEDDVETGDEWESDRWESDDEWKDAEEKEEE